MAKAGGAVVDWAAQLVLLVKASKNSDSTSVAGCLLPLEDQGRQVAGEMAEKVELAEKARKDAELLLEAP